MGFSDRIDRLSSKAVLAISLLCAAACIGLVMLYITMNNGQAVQSSVSASAAASAQPAPEPEPLPDPAVVKAEELLSTMSTEQKIAQLLLVRADKMSQDEIIGYLGENGAGGLVLFADNFKGKDQQQVIEMMQSFQSAAGGNLLMCVDEEGGTVVRVSSNDKLRANRFKSPQDVFASGGMGAVRSDTHEKCVFLKSFGINVNFAPVADVVTSRSGFLYKRAFGSNAEQTAEYVSAVVGVMEENNMGSSIKHFPGYGNASGDTHDGLVRSNVTAESLYSSDLVPFEAGIAAGADSVMITHTIINAIDPNNPASLSPAAVSLLRDELGFDGVIITDGLDMGAIEKFCGTQDPCVMALAAGADLMCTPTDCRASYNALVEAVNDGTISIERLDESVLRILVWKVRLGLYDM